MRMNNTDKIIVNKGRLKADVLTIVETIIEDLYEQEVISKFTLQEYANVLVATSTVVINEVIKGDVSKEELEKIVQEEVDKLYKL